MVVADSIFSAFVNVIGGADFYVGLFSMMFAFVVVYFFYKITL